MAFDTTVGATTATSYASVAFAETYFAETGRSDKWQQAIDAAGMAEAALTFAMLYIEGQPFLGSRSDADPDNPQALDFPRRVPVSGTFGTSSGETWKDRRGRQWTFDAIPTPIAQAQCEQALELQLSSQFTDETLKRKEIKTAEGVLEFKVGADAVGSICARAALLFSPFIAGGAAAWMNGRSHR